MEEYAYIEILIEDQSGEILVKNIMDKYITEVPGIKIGRASCRERV